MAGDYCVKYTALDSRKLGYETFVLEEAVKCVDPGTWDAVKGEFNDFGIKVVSVEGKEVEWIQQLRGK